MAEKNSAQTNKQTDRQTDKPIDTMKIMVTWPWTNTLLFLSFTRRDTHIHVFYLSRKHHKIVI